MQSSCGAFEAPDMRVGVTCAHLSCALRCAGQVVMEGFLRIRLPPWIRRLSTRLVAVVPAAVVAGVIMSSCYQRLLWPCVSAKRSSTLNILPLLGALPVLACKVC